MTTGPDTDSKQKNEYFVYILHCIDDTLYTGMTNDLKHRLSMHNSGKASRYTKSRLPVNYVYIESGFSKSDALKREYQIKHMNRKQKLALISKADI